jgi:TonB family protein
VFKGPKPVDLPLPQYPMGQFLDGVEGWVHVNFMVDTQGKPYEVAVVESSGNDVFDKLAISTVEKWKFTPAMLGNQPTDASEDYKINFTMPVPATGARIDFVRAYRALGQAIDAGDQASAADQLQKLEVRNLYEDVFKALASYNYHVKWGKPNEQLADLRRALAHESRPRYLPKRDFVAVLNGMLMLQVQAQDYGSALDTFDRLQRFSRSSAKDWQPSIDKIEALRKSADPVRIHSEMTSHSWHHRLFKDHFQIAVASGKVSDIKLRCKKAYVFFHYQPGVQYKVESRSGNCWMELIGEPGTTFDLTQS